MCQSQCLRPEEIFKNSHDKVLFLQELPGHLERQLFRYLISEFLAPPMDKALCLSLDVK